MIAAMAPEREESYMSLEGLDAWAWRRHGEEILRARDKENPLDRIEAEGQAAAFEETCKYIRSVREAINEGKA